MINCLLGGLILAIFYFYSNKSFYGQQNINVLKLVISISLFTFLSMLLNIYGTEPMTIIIKIIMTYIMFCIFTLYIYRKSINEVIISSFIIYLLIFISETLVAIILSLIIKLQGLDSMEVYQNTILINLIIYGIAYLIILVFKNKLKVFIKKGSISKKHNFLIAMLIIITVTLLGIKIPLTEWKLSMDFIITMLLLLLCSIIGFILVKQKNMIDDTKSMYQQVVKYSNTTNKLLEDYRIVSHEHKNQLSIIRQMIPDNNKDLIDYIDNLIDKRNTIKYKWISDLNNLPLDGLRGLINYKLLEAEADSIILMINISKDLSKFKNKLEKLNTRQKDNLYSIVGVYLDNAIQASKESKKKEVSIDMYKDNKDIVCIIGNTYKGHINLEKIDNYGYTTKGKNHGIGLHIVKSILDDSNLFSQTRKIIDQYYVQELRIHTNEIKNKK